MTRKENQLPKRHLDPRIVDIRLALLRFSAEETPLLGIVDQAKLECLVRQIIDSIRRVEFVKRVSARRYPLSVADPASSAFDPLKAAVLRSTSGDLDDAVWLVFLAVHFGKHAKDGWSLVRFVYGGLSSCPRWNWGGVSQSADEFLQWLEENQSGLSKFRFSNHRKYESLSARSPTGTGSVISSYIDWINSDGSFQQIIRRVHQEVGQNPRDVFRQMYKEVGVIRRFGRLAKFDFLSLLGKLGLAPIVPDSAYIGDNATGPYRGIRLLVTGDVQGKLSRAAADEIYVDLGKATGLGMQELEDALCNWQKSPDSYVLFMG